MLRPEEVDVALQARELVCVCARVSGVHGRGEESMTAGLTIHVTKTPIL
jgi:hypothetical protein